MKNRSSTKSELEQQLSIANNDNTLLIIALQCAMVETADISARKGDYRVSAYRLGSASGGIVILTYAPKGQSPSVCARYVEDWHSNIYRTRALVDNEDLSDQLELAFQVKSKQVEILK